MDKSRERDLTLLKERMHNTSLPLSARLRADKVYHQICSKLNDRRLNNLRYQLILAHQAGDSISAENIGEMIHDHEYKAYGLAEVS
jgi:hypothetical protein